MTARVEPVVGLSEVMLVISLFRESRREREMALRAGGRFRERILMLPLWGAGMEVTFIGGEVVE